MFHKQQILNSWCSTIAANESQRFNQTNLCGVNFHAWTQYHHGQLDCPKFYHLSVEASDGGKFYPSSFRLDASAATGGLDLLAVYGCAPMMGSARTVFKVMFPMNLEVTIGGERVKVNTTSHSSPYGITGHQWWPAPNSEIPVAKLWLVNQLVIAYLGVIGCSGPSFLGSLENKTLSGGWTKPPSPGGHADPTTPTDPSHPSSRFCRAADGTAGA